MSGIIGSIGGNGIATAGTVQDPRAQARILQKQLDRELDGIPSPTRLHVQMDAAVGRIVVQVVDTRSGDVLRQIPREEALVLARAMAKQAGRGN